MDFSANQSHIHTTFFIRFPQESIEFNFQLETEKVNGINISDFTGIKLKTHSVDGKREKAEKVCYESEQSQDLSLELRAGFKVIR